MTKTTLTLCSLLLTAVLLLATGCSEEQLRHADQAIQDANHVAQGVSAIAQGPAGSLIPPQVRQIMEFLGVGALAALAIWKKIQASGLLRKNQDLTSTLRNVAEGVENFQAADQAKGEELKGEIARVMASRSPQNVVIDDIKKSLPTVEPAEN